MAVCRSLGYELAAGEFLKMGAWIVRNCLIAFVLALTVGCVWYGRTVKVEPEDPTAAMSTTDAASDALTKNDPSEPVGQSDAVRVQISGLRPQGTVNVAVFDAPEGFPLGEHATQVQTVAVSSATMDVTLDDVGEGPIAVAVFQDLNDDGVLTKNSFGIPSEPYGFSNNARGLVGPPEFRAAAVTVSTDDRQIDVVVK